MDNAPGEFDAQLLGDRIRKARVAAQLTQADLAERVTVERSVFLPPEPISSSSISAYENAASSPTSDILQQIATICGVDFAWMALTAKQTPADDDATPEDTKPGTDRIAVLQGDAWFTDHGVTNAAAKPANAGCPVVSADPDVYAWTIRGRGCEPDIRDGWTVVISPGGEPVPGEFVYLSYHHAPEWLIAELLWERGDAVTVLSLGACRSRPIIPRDRIQALHPVIDIQPPSRLVEIAG